MARNCLVVGAREGKQWQDFSKARGEGRGVAGVREEQLELEAWAPERRGREGDQGCSSMGLRCGGQGCEPEKGRVVNHTHYSSHIYTLT